MSASQFFDARFVLFCRDVILTLNREMLKSATKLLDSDDTFKRDLANIAGQRLLDDMVSFKTQEALLGLATSEVLRARVAHRQWQLQRTTGLRKVSTRVQSALMRFKEYMDCYSGLVDIVKQADQKFGGLAYSTLSVFLVVCIPYSLDNSRIADWAYISSKIKRKKRNSS